MTKPTEIFLNETKSEQPKESIADLMRKVIAILGEDPEREGLRKTPERFEKAQPDFTDCGIRRHSMPKP